MTTRTAAQRAGGRAPRRNRVAVRFSGHSSACLPAYFSA
ncbi:hypothetical protein C7S16_4223 [Burkholderia thailandensis]|uniref:Uncharacterized protein n=1 Tax=Burkholderia thailandensis TaxID=57975 RepID=A0AAW9CIT2_BURTH|nr:hypothetical protein [Burkholderia thailandensis]MDW9250870.1 hypothetical protein [Burkholderia thailandensis]